MHILVELLALELALALLVARRHYRRARSREYLATLSDFFWVSRQSITILNALELPCSLTWRPIRELIVIIIVGALDLEWLRGRAKIGVHIRKRDILERAWRDGLGTPIRELVAELLLLACDRRPRL